MSAALVAGWEQAGLCAQTDPEVFFPDKGGSSREAKAVCLGCTVRVECLEEALARDERFGVWGGLSEQERRREAKRRAEQAGTVASTAMEAAAASGVRSGGAAA